MGMMAQFIVAAAGVFFVALGGAALLPGPTAGRFLLGFAGTAAKHYAELAVRIVVGCAFVIHAPQMLFARAFGAFGWILIVTTAGLLLIPWRWHRRFAETAVPQALRFLPLIGIASAAFGTLVLIALFSGRS